jgi:hypothetical protein
VVINFQNDSQLNVIFNNKAEQVLLANGYDKMSDDDKNSLIAIIANKEGKVLNAVTDDYILTYHKKIKCAALDDACNNAILAGFTSTNTHKYTIDFIDQIDFLAQKMALNDDATITSVLWKAEDVGDWISHTRDEWLNNVYGEAFSFAKTQRSNCQQLKLKVNQATDHPTIVAVVWS